mmetsp:Transcript_16453/g.39115  ORF Transcript_16453/g.39115 Transcript_16453/m.39115 type:complete len:273 (-) Transcript_16453:1612-2430(-)
MGSSGCRGGCWTAGLLGAACCACCTDDAAPPKGDWPEPPQSAPPPPPPPCDPKMDPPVVGVGLAPKSPVLAPKSPPPVLAGGAPAAAGAQELPKGEKPAAGAWFGMPVGTGALAGTPPKRSMSKQPRGTSLAWKACSAKFWTNSSFLEIDSMLCMASTWPLTAASRSVSLASGGPENERRSLGIWYLMKSCMRSCVSLISLVRLSVGRLSTFSSWGLMWTITSPKSVLSSCMERIAFANLCCSGESDSMASRNSRAVGMVDSSKPMDNSSLF